MKDYIGTSVILIISIIVSLVIVFYIPTLLP